MVTPLAIVDLLAIAPFLLLYGTTDTFQGNRIRNM